MVSFETKNVLPLDCFLTESHLKIYERKNI